MSTEEKFWKRNCEKQKLNTAESVVGRALFDIENNSSEFKRILKDVYIDSVKEIDVTLKGKKIRTVYLVYIPFVCYKIYKKNSKLIISELEKAVKQ